MEHGSYEDPTQATFSFTDEDHTLANSLRFVLNKDPRVTSSGYSIPHPSEARVNIQLHTTAFPGNIPSMRSLCYISNFLDSSDPPSEVLKDSCQNLMLMCQHVRSTFDQAFTKFKSENAS